jgi:hypothetical protein
MFWEQINSVIQDSDGQELWVVDDHFLGLHQHILFSSFPAFIGLQNTPDRHTLFLHSEWQATLTSMLWSRRDQVLNGHWLVGRVWLQRNKHIFLPHLWKLGWPLNDAQIKRMLTNFGHYFIIGQLRPTQFEDLTSVVSTQTQ